jgi:hypothetical protein
MQDFETLLFSPCHLLENFQYTLESIDVPNLQCRPPLNGDGPGRCGAPFAGRRSTPV